MDDKEVITLKGLVIAAAWEHNGEVSAVDLAGYDEKRYRVADDIMSDQLRRFIMEKVIVEGTVRLENQRHVIYVDNFRLDDS